MPPGYIRAQLVKGSERPDYNLFLPAALTFAHLARATAAILARAAALSLRLGLRAAPVGFLVPFTLAQRARCAAAILARAAALIRCFLLTEEAEATPLTSWFSWLCKESIFSLRSAIWRSCWLDKFVIALIKTGWQR